MAIDTTWPPTGAPKDPATGRANFAEIASRIALLEAPVIEFGFQGKPPADAVIFWFVATTGFTLPEDLVGALVKAKTAATASYTVTLEKNGSSIGSLVWSAAGTEPAVTFNADVAFTSGDTFAAIGQATPDSTLSDIFFHIPTAVAATPNNALEFGFQGVPDDSATLLYYVATSSFTLPQDLAGSVIKAKTAATGTPTASIKRNSTEIGTLDWGAAATEPTITFSGAVAFVSGDVLETTGDSSADATLADIFFHLVLT